MIKDSKRLDSASTVLISFIKDMRLKDCKSGKGWDQQTIAFCKKAFDSDPTSAKNALFKLHRECNLVGSIETGISNVVMALVGKIAEGMNTMEQFLTWYVFRYE